MSKVISARSFASQFSLDEMLNELRLLNSNWLKRDNEQFGEYLVARFGPEKIVRARIVAKENDFVLEILCESEDQQLAEYFVAVFINLLLPIVRAESIHESDTLD